MNLVAANERVVLSFTSTFNMFSRGLASLNDEGGDFGEVHYLLFVVLLTRGIWFTDIPDASFCVLCCSPTDTRFPRFRLLTQPEMFKGPWPPFSGGWPWQAPPRWSRLGLAARCVQSLQSTKRFTFNEHCRQTPAAMLDAGASGRKQPFNDQNERLLKEKNNTKHTCQRLGH